MSSADDFGHFRLPLTLNKGNIDVKVAERLFETTNRYLSRFTESRPEHYANWNLLGMLSFRIGQFEDALQYLDKVLSPDEDPDNLNALANRKYICEKLYRFTEAQDCQQIIAGLLRQDDTEEGKKRLRKLRARSISERAFAFTNEIFEESVTTERYRKSFDLYQAAIELAEGDVGQSEREDWIFESGLVCRSIYSRIKWDKSKSEEVKKWYQDAVNNFITIVQISEDKDRKSRAWRNLGNLFKPGNLLPFIPDTIRIYVDEPHKCFEEALSLTPNDPRVLTEQAKRFIKTDQTKALFIINRAIEVDCSEFNPRARDVRANIYLSQYKKQLKDGYSFRHPDDTLLVRAKKDLSFAIKDVSKPWYKESMAEVLYYMATNRDGVLKPGSEVQLQQALTYCAKAVESADGAKRANVHKLRGMCLCAMGEHQAALGSYKRALECEIATSYPKGSASALVSEYKHILPVNHSDLKEDLSLLGDMVYWLHKAACIFLETNWDSRQLKTLRQMRNHWAIFVKYCKDNGYERELKDIELSADIRTNRSGLQQPFPSTHVRYDTARSTQGRNQIPFAASSDGGAASRVFDASSRSHEKQYQKQPPAQRKQLPLHVSVEEGSLPSSVTGRQQSFQASSTTTYNQPPYRAQREQLSDEKRDDIDVDNLSKSLAAVQLDKNAAASDTVQVTYTVNVKTGKVEQPPIISSSSSESCAENPPSKHIKPGPAKPFNRQYEYDFFVIYASSALEWVEHSMLEELEGTSSLLGCVKDRDFSLGKPTLLNYSESIDKSACTIVVVTKDLEVDSLCCHAMLVAVGQGRLVIPVLKEARDMPVPLRPFTHLDATGAVDWRRLERSIEQQIRLET